MARGLMDAGCEIVKAYDSWPTAVGNYNANLPPHAVVQDLGDMLKVVPEILALAPDIITGGPPCQDWSIVGRRTEAERATMTLAFAMIVSVTRPRWFLMENVIPAAKSPTWQQACQVLRNAGYGLTVSRLTASHYGVAQNRRRLIVIGRLGERDGFLASSIASVASSDKMTMRDLFVGENPDDVALIQKGFVYSRPVREGRGVRSIDEPFPCVVRTAHGRPTARYLDAPHKGDPVPALETAVLTVRQMSRIQSFPDWWTWKANKHDVLQMIANAVPPALAEAMGRVILDRDHGKSAPAVEGKFSQWLVKRGRSKHSARNTKSHLVRARRLLNGRTFSNGALEAAALERVDDFQGMGKNTQSDLRQALRLYSEYLESRCPPTRMAKAIVHPDDHVVILQDYERKMQDMGEPDVRPGARIAAVG